MNVYFQPDSTLNVEFDEFGNAVAHFKASAANEGPFIPTTAGRANDIE